MILLTFKVVNNNYIYKLNTNLH